MIAPEPELPEFLTEDLPTERPGLPADFGVGSEVLVLPTTYGRRRVKQERIPGTVTQAARVWLTVETAWHPGYRLGRSYLLRRDTQDDGSKGHYKDRFRTPEQDRWDRAEWSASDYLREQEITVEHHSRWRHRLVELARAVWYLEHP